MKGELNILKYGGLVILALIFIQVTVYAQNTTITIPYQEKPNVKIDGVIQDGEYPASYQDLETGMEAFWVHDDQYIYVGLKSPGTGWVGIGFGSSLMSGANIIIGYVDDQTGEVHISDETGKGHRHSSDESLGGQNNIVSYAGSQQNNSTIIEFLFPLKSSDSLDPEIKIGKPIDIILAYHPTADDFTSYHGSTYSILTALVEAPKVRETKIEISVNGTSLSVGEAVQVNIRLLTKDDKPVKNATVFVYGTTTFKDAGFIPVAKIVTDDSGSGSTIIKYEVPGNFTIYASFEGSADYKPSKSKTYGIKVVQPTKVWIVHPEDPYYNWGWFIINLPHASHGTPDLNTSIQALAVMVPLFLIVGGVWLTYVYVYSLIFRIKRGGGR